MNFYYADSDNNPVGPHELTELKKLEAEGKLHGNSWIIEEGGEEWKAYSEILKKYDSADSQETAPEKSESEASPTADDPAPGTSTSVVTDVLPSDGNHTPVNVIWAILWFLLCFPIGFMMWGQTAKGWLWFLIAVITGGIGTVVAWVDFWMSWSVQQNRQVEPWEWFPTK